MNIRFLLVMKTLKLVLKKGEHILHCIAMCPHINTFFEYTSYPGNVEFCSTQTKYVAELCFKANILMFIVWNIIVNLYCKYVCLFYIVLSCSSTIHMIILFLLVYQLMS